MKQIKLLKAWQKFLIFLLGIFGLSYCSSADLYGSPQARFSLNINVTDTNSKQLENIKITVKKQTSGNNYSVQEILTTDSNGKSNYTFFDDANQINLRLIFKDSENKYKEDSLDVISNPGDFDVDMKLII